MLSDGLLNKQIAYGLVFRKPLSKAHMTTIFRKLGVKTGLRLLSLLKELNNNLLAHVIHLTQQRLPRLANANLLSSLASQRHLQPPNVSHTTQNGHPTQGCPQMLCD